MKVGARPVAVAVCAATVVVARRDAVVSEVEPKTSTLAVIPIGGTPADVSDVGALAAVVSGPPSMKVTVIDTAYGGVTAVVPLPGAPSSPPAVASDGTSFWIANPNAHELERIGRPYTGVVEAIPLPTPAGKLRKTGYAGVAVGEQAVWVAGDNSDRTLWRIDPMRRRVVATIRLPFAPEAVAAGKGAVWVADRRGDEVVRFDARTNLLVARIRVGRGPTAIAASADSIWVANERDGTVSRIDPRRNVVERTIAVGSEPVDLAAGLGGVWVIRRTA
jgi:YVTN family beta-propeller protein